MSHGSLIRSACILIVKDDKILAISRKNNHNDFGLIGGKCEIGESFEDAAIRELIEETTLIATNPKFVFERQDGIFIVRTFTPKTYYGEIPSDESQIKRGEGLVKWVPMTILLTGSFGAYNERLFRHLNMIA